jgi:Flp pilus assembly pilin Flp
MKELCCRLWRDESGQGLVEYVLIIGMVAIFLVAALTIFRGKIVTLFTKIGDALDAAPT